MAKKKDQWIKITKESMPPIGKFLFVGHRGFGGQWKIGPMILADNFRLEHLTVDHGLTHWVEAPAWLRDGPPAPRTGERNSEVLPEANPRNHPNAT